VSEALFHHEKALICPVKAAVHARKPFLQTIRRSKAL
jgi:hypothetical protein